MFDLFGQELAVGDEVATMVKEYRNLVIGKIIKMTPMRIYVEYMTHNGYLQTYKVSPDMLIKNFKN